MEQNYIFVFILVLTLYTCYIDNIVTAYTVNGKPKSTYIYTDDDAAADDIQPLLNADVNFPDESDAIDGTFKEKGIPAKKGIQFMITGRMRAILENDLNYLPEEVDVLEPQIAAVLIEKSLVRPEHGMPSTWKRPVMKKPLFVDFKSNLSRRIIGLRKHVHRVSGRVLRFTQRHFLPIALPVIAIAVGVNIIRSGYGDDILPQLSSTLRSSSSLIMKAKSLLSSKPVKRKTVDLNLLRKVQDPNVLDKFKLKTDIIRRKFF